MIKYQLKIITDFVDKHTSKGFGLDSSADYVNLIILNIDVDYLLDIYSSEHNFENHDFDEADSEKLKYCQNQLKGLIEIYENNDKLSFGDLVIVDFDTTRQYVQTSFIKDKEKANKELTLQRIYFTKKFYKFCADLRNLETHPFVPSKVKVEVKKITSNVLRNIQILYESLSAFVKNQKAGKYQEILLDFNSKKIDIVKNLDELRKVINEHFKVDKI